MHVEGVVEGFGSSRNLVLLSDEVEEVAVDVKVQGMAIESHW